MPTTYEQADESVTDMLAKVLKQYHGELVEVETRVGVLMAHNADGPAVKLRGWPCAAVVRIRNLKDRVAGLPDAEIVIDSSRWDDMSEPERVALLDHECHHLELQREKETRNPKTDDIGRPKLKMRPHDHEFGWFDTIAHRHGDASAEVQQAKSFADKHGQTYFGWGQPPERETEDLPAKVPQKKNVTTADGRHITPDEMMDEIGATFARARR